MPFTVTVKLRNRRYTPSYHYRPGDFEAFAKWFELVFERGGEDASEVILGGVLKVVRKRAESEADFKARVFDALIEPMALS